MPRQLVTAGVVILAMAPAVAGADLASCRALSEPLTRLACYDALPAEDAPVFRGAGNTITPAIEIREPKRLVFESSDAVLVVYLLDAAGRVVQNLHHAGAGRSSYDILDPGRYRLQINATGGWQIWLEPKS